MLTPFDLQALIELLDRTPMSMAELVGTKTILDKIQALIEIPHQEAKEEKPLTPNP